MAGSPARPSRGWVQKITRKIQATDMGVAARASTPSSGTPGEGGGGGSREAVAFVNCMPAARTPTLALPRSTGGGKRAAKAILSLAALAALALALPLRAAEGGLAAPPSTRAAGPGV